MRARCVTGFRRWPGALEAEPRAVAADWPHLVAFDPPRLAFRATIARLAVAHLGRPPSRRSVHVCSRAAGEFNHEVGIVPTSPWIGWSFVVDGRWLCCIKVAQFAVGRRLPLLKGACGWTLVKRENVESLESQISKHANATAYCPIGRKNGRWWKRLKGTAPYVSLFGGRHIQREWSHDVGSSREYVN